MPKIYFHVDVNSAFLSWSALKSLQDGGTVDLRTIPAVVAFAWNPVHKRKCES